MRKLLFILWALCSTLLAGGLKDTAQVQKDVKAIYKAMTGEDSLTIEKLSHSYIRRVSGGQFAMRKMIQNSFKAMKKLGMAFGEPEFKYDPTFIKTEKNEYCLIPFAVPFSLNGDAYIKTTFQLGHKEKVPSAMNKWRYIDGSQLSLQQVRSIFKDFPEDQELPEVSEAKAE